MEVVWNLVDGYAQIKIDYEITVHFNGHLIKTGTDSLVNGETTGEPLTLLKEEKLSFF